MDWWDKTFSDAGWRERRSRDQVAEDLDKGDTDSAVKRLFALDEAQAHEIERLRLTVKVLTEILVDNMGLDPGLLHQRMTDAANEVEVASHEPKSEAAVGGKARCSICSAPAEIQATHFAGFGLVCDPCHARGAPGEDSEDSDS